MGRKMTKLAEKSLFSTQVEMAAKPELTLREAWVIQNLDGDYLRSFLQGNKVVSYCAERDEAEWFPTYEEASLRAKTLDIVVRKGHKLHRFMTRRISL
jgi:hypothetical protein